jgi:hypothetical protein
MSISKLKDKKVKDDRKDDSFENISLSKLNILDLPEDVFETIAGFFGKKDIENCTKVCDEWKQYLDKSKFLKKCCIYPEKYYKLSAKPDAERCKSSRICDWRNSFLIQKRILENWKHGIFVKESSGINASNLTCLVDSVDDNGNHWLFDFGQQGIKVWNITTQPFLHSEYSQNNFFGLLPLQDKVLTCRSNYMKIFQFRHPDYELKLDYRFKFEMDDVLPNHIVIPDEEYVSGVRYILVDNQFFIGYSENITDIERAFIHIWDLNSGRKVATQSVFQDSFSELIRSSGGDVLNDFRGGLILFAADQGRFLVNLIDARYNLCHISLFSLLEMKFTKVVAVIESRTAWCFMKGDIIAIFHIVQEESSQISVFNVKGDLLDELYFPAIHNPAFTDEFKFDSDKVILKVDTTINVLTINDDTIAHKNHFVLDEELFILKYFDPKFLLLFDRRWNIEYSVTTWDIDNGTKLWELGLISKIYLYRQLFCNYEYPGRLVVYFKGEEELSILKFDQDVLTDRLKNVT